VERAVDWLFSHPDDVGQDDAPALTNGPAEIEQGPANYELKGFISHKGTSVHCGHYVAHVKQDGRWVLYNDEKVVQAVKPPVEEAYIYIFEKNQ